MTSEKSKPRHGRTRRERLRAALPAVVIVVAVLPLALFGALTHDRVVAEACRITGCTPAGMAAAAWLILVVPVWLVCLIALVRSTPLRVLIAAVTALPASVATAFWPGHGSRIGELVTGPGSPAFRTGLRWGVLTVLLTVGIALTVNLAGGPSFRRGRMIVPANVRRARRLGVLAAVTVAAITLATALLRAG